jgi:hypothetical protein
MIEYKVITENDPHELWASGFYNDYGRMRAQAMVDGGYWHAIMNKSDKHKKLVVVPVKS